MQDIHLSILALTAVVILISDEMGLAWMLGRRQMLKARTMRILHRLVWAGLLGMIATGLAMFLPARAFYLSEPFFLVKMGIVLVLIVNAFAIGRLQRVASEKPFAALSRAERLPLLISGTVSTIGWISAALIGLFLL